MKFGFIGFGNLGRAAASGLVMSGSAGNSDISVCETSSDARAVAEGAPYYAYVSADVNEILVRSDVVFLVVKGYVFDVLSAEIDRRNLEGKTVVSFMAGESFEKIYSLIGQVDLVRAMPSLAISVCDGVIGYTKAPPALVEVFDKLGFAFETEPENIEKVMAFASCGLGFAAYLIDAFKAAGETMGFSPDTCEQIAALTFRNACDRGDFRNTVKSVATPGGATEQGVIHMDKNNVFNIVAQAVRSAYDRMT